MTEREDLQFLAPVTTHQQERESKDVTEDEVEERPEHNQPGWPLPHRAQAINLIRSTHPVSTPHPHRPLWVWAAGQVAGPDQEEIFSGLRRLGRG
jgi:hypothetical protein